MGNRKRVRRLSRYRENKYPALRRTGYYVTSDETPEYNCIAYAAGDETRKWGWPPCLPGWYWPPGAQPGGSIDALKSAFEAVGFAQCAADDSERGFEKVALYANGDGGWEHAAKQLPNGEWSSKLGDWEDIRHIKVNAFAGSDYGLAVYYMKRPIKETGCDETKAQADEGGQIREQDAQEPAPHAGAAHLR
jgi:hypothetical protein